MKCNIIGDIHGQTKWKDLIIPDTATIFVGDYFSPYFPIPFEEQKKNFLEIMKFKDDNEEDVICLLGNHDLEYFFTAESYSRHDRSHEKEIEKLFKEYLDHFWMACSVEDKILVTHAGVTKDWFNKLVKSFGLDDDNNDPDHVSELINFSFDQGKSNYNLSRLFEFYPNASYRSDYCGESPTQSCVWIRPWTLRQCDLFEGKFKQVFGHTINQSLAGVSPDKGFEEGCLIPLTSDNVNDFNLYMVDCLSYDTASLIYDSETEEFSINKPNLVNTKSVTKDQLKSAEEVTNEVNDNLDKLIAAI